MQNVSGPTHKKGHTLDLVLSYGLPILNLVIDDHVFSDHNPIRFELALSSSALSSTPRARTRRTFTPHTAARFSDAFGRCYGKIGDHRIPRPSHNPAVAEFGGPHTPNSAT